MKPWYKFAFVSLVTLAAATGCQKNESDTSPAAGGTDQPAAGTASPESSGTGMEQQASPSSATQTQADGEITMQVKAALDAVPELKSNQLNVETKDGVVTLTGSIDTPQNLDRATQVAQAVNGVKSVNNKLSVKAQG